MLYQRVDIPNTQFKLKKLIKAKIVILIFYQTVCLHPAYWSSGYTETVVSF